jgi:diguanylate cyclase (GGDEF)-like protein/hemerythrin-like metal-binding protein
LGYLRFEVALPMNTFIWDHYYETGLAVVDDQHQRLVALINQLGDLSLVEGSAAATTLKEVFANLTAYANVHFGDEEQLMRAEHILPQYLVQHCAIHAEFMTQITLLWESRNAIAGASQTLLGFLVSWLSFHILGEDQAMAAQIAAIRAGATPEHAYEQMQAHESQDRRARALIDALQGLYRTLSSRNRELGESNRRLEERVAERTRILDETNTALRVAFDKMEELALVDGLLGIANRRNLDLRLELEWQRSFRERLPISFLMIDVDHFKRYNDACGHQAGDDCLKAVTKTISYGRRATDLLARYGGEEFAVLLPNTPLTGGKIVADAVRCSVIEASIAHPDSPVADHVTVSIGVASCTPAKLTGAADLIAAADGALYAAKETGRNRVVLAAPP